MHNIPVKNIECNEFEADLCNICGSFNIQPHEGQQYVKGCLDVENKAGIEVAYVGQNSYSVNRSKQNIRQDPGNHYFLILQNRGQSEMIQGTVSEPMVVGDMFLVDSTRPSLFHYGGHNSLQTALHLPRQEMDHRFGASIYGGIHISKIDPLGRAIRAILTDLLLSERPGQAHVVEAFHSVLGALLLNRSLGNKSKLNPGQAIINRALNVMSHHYRDPEFTTNHVADLLGVSLRQMQRVFKERQEGPHRSLQNFRLDAATELIESGTNQPNQSISSVAFDCGFTDLSTFYRQFKDRHGHSPGEHFKRHRKM